MSGRRGQWEGEGGGGLRGREGETERGSGGWWGASSQEANRCSPSGVSQMADIKKRVFFWFGEDEEEDEGEVEEEEA